MSTEDAGSVTVTRPEQDHQLAALALVLLGLLAAVAASRFGWHDLNLMAVATNAAGLTLLTQRATRPNA